MSYESRRSNEFMRKLKIGAAGAVLGTAAFLTGHWFISGAIGVATFSAIRYG